jgi:hypothetical protein
MPVQTKKVMFDGIEYDCTVSIDRNSDFLFESVEKTEDGKPMKFVKFPRTVKPKDALAAHNEANKDIPVTPEVEAAVSQEQLDQLAELFS